MATDMTAPDDPLPTGRDPGGAHSKGYTAETEPGVDDPPDPVPLADPPRGAKVHPPETHEPPTGRGNTGDSGLILPEGG